MGLLGIDVDASNARGETVMKPIVDDPDLLGTFVADQATAFGATPLTDVSITAIASDAPVPVGVLADGVLYGATATHLHASTDSGAAWTQLSAVNIAPATTPRRIFELASGEVLVVRQTTIIRSTGWAANPAIATWAVVHSIADRTVNFDSWSVDCKGDKIIATEYGLYADEPWRVWISVNGGDSFTLVLDLETEYEPGQLDGTHMHGVAYDEHRDTFWAANGDDAGAAQVWWSDDDGATWNAIDNAIAKERHTALMPMPYGVILGADAGSAVALNGAYRINPDDPEDITLAHEINVGRPGLTHIGASSQVGSDGIGYMAFMPWQEVGIPSVLLASVDGRSVQEVWRDPEPVTGVTTQRQLVLAVGPDANGNIIGHLSSASSPNGWRVVGSASRRGGVVASRQDLGRVAGGVAEGQSSSALSASSEARSAQCVAIGALARAGGHVDSISNTAIGYDARAGTDAAASPQATAIGFQARALTFGATAIGAGAQAVQSALAIGYQANSQGLASVALGYQARTPYAQSVAVGQGAESRFTQSVAIGRAAIADSVEALAAGEGTYAGWKATALGRGANALYESSVALGHLSATSAGFQVQIAARHIEMSELAADPAAPAANNARLYVKDSGGETILCVRTSSGVKTVTLT